LAEDPKQPGVEDLGAQLRTQIFASAWSSSAKLVLLAMAETLGPDGLCREPAPRLASMVGMTARYVEITLASLKGKAIHQVEKGGGRGRSSAYRIEIGAENPERISGNQDVNTEIHSVNSGNPEPISGIAAQNPEYSSGNSKTNPERKSGILQNPEIDSVNTGNPELHSGNSSANPEIQSGNNTENPERISGNPDAYKELTYLPTNPPGETTGRPVGGARADSAIGNPQSAKPPGPQWADGLGVNADPAVAAFEEIFERRITIFEQEAIAAKIGAGNLDAWRLFLSEYKREYRGAKNLSKALVIFEKRQADLEKLEVESGPMPPSPGRVTHSSSVRQETRNTAGNSAVFDAWERQMEERLNGNN
jgi:hypothetical protein